MIASSFPVLRLKPKANARAIRHGAPWVYDNELVLDRRSKNLAPGTIAVLEDAERNPMGLVATNPLSRITARMIERDVSVAIDQAWFAAKIKRALELRERLFDHPFYRLIHAEADGLPGLVVDRFDSALVVQPNAAWLEVLIEPLATALAEVTGATTILKNAAGRTRVLEGLDDENGVLLGTAPNAPVMVPMNGAHYAADLTGGQKTGLFYDQRPNHAFVARLSEGRGCFGRVFTRGRVRLGGPCWGRKICTLRGWLRTCAGFGRAGGERRRIWR